MPTDKKRVYLTPDPATFALLGIDTEQDKSVNAWTVSAQLRRYSCLIERATAELGSVLTRDEWNMIAACLGGPDDIYDHADAGLSPLTRILAEVEDGHRLSREGDRWLTDADGVPTAAQRKQADAAVADLLRRLVTLTPLHAEAILAAVRWFWHHTEIDHTVVEWWSAAYRLAEIHGRE